MADDIAKWLEGHGLGQYARAFIDNDIDFEVLPHLTDAESAELGMSLGHRNKLRRAIEALDEPALDSLTEAQEVSTQEAERRQITVLFCDLAGSTALAARLDPEDLREVLRRYQTACATAVERYDGYVAKYMGDGVFVYFGYPRAHEDDAERAIRAALSIVEAVGALEADLAVRIGIATGTVVVGDILGEGAAEEASVTGETPNLAARLQEVAVPDAIVAAPTTRALVGDLFAFEDLGGQALKGFDAPVRAWRVTGEGGAESRFDAVRAHGLTPLTGRDEELGLVLRRWQQAKDGDGQAVMLSGEAGIGKSRLVDALRERISGEPHFRLRYQCSPYHANSALYPIIQRLERAAGITREDSNAARHDKLVARLATSGEPGPETVSLLADLLSIPLDARYPRLDMDPGQKKQQTLEALAGQVASLAHARPVLFVFEDAHWADPTSLELLDRVIERAPAQRLVVLITARPEFAAPWAGQPHTTFLTLNRLARRDCAAMAERVSGGRILPEALIEQIVARTDGVPLFVEELIKTLLESDLVANDGDRLVMAGSLDALAIPATLKDSLTARLDRLGPAKEIAQIGAAIGREFGHELLASVAALDPAALEAALEPLIRSELVFRRGSQPDATYVFKHALVQDAAYDSLLRRRRAELHARIAATLEARFPETCGAEPDLLAHHFTEAGDAEPAAEYWLKAGQAAFRGSAMAEAIAHVRRGQTVAEALPEGPSRQALAVGLQAMLALALKARDGAGNADSGEAFSRALALCRDDTSSPHLFPVLFGVFHYHHARGPLDQARAEADELLRLAKAADDDAKLLVAHTAQGMVLLLLGENAAARDHLDVARALYDPVAHRSLAFTYMLEFGVAHSFFSAITNFMLGYPDRALEWAEGSIALARERQPINLCASLSFGFLVPMARGQWALARSWAEEAYSTAQKHGFSHAVAHSRVNHGIVLVHLDRVEEGLDQIREGIELARPTGYDTWLGHHLMCLADAYVAAGRPEDALDALIEAETLARETGNRHCESQLLRARGDVALTLDRSSEAEARFRDAIDVARAQDAKSWELHAAIRLARLLRGNGRGAEARDLLAPIYGWFTEGFDTADLKEAKALLDEMS